MTMLAKIHPYNPSLGYHRKRHICPPYTFREEWGWYEVDDEIAEKLRKEFNNSGDPTSRPVFIIASKDEAGAMDKAEQEIAAKAVAPRALPKEMRDKQKKADKAAAAKVLEDEFDAEFDGEEDLAPESEEIEPEAKESEPEAPKKTAKRRKKVTRRRKKS